MKLSEVKQYLSGLDELIFSLPDGSTVASHFHVTEVGLVHKHFIDCGGTIREEKVANFQLWQANDYDHRLAPEKLIDIIELSERKLGLGDHEVEVEYQGETIGKYGLKIGKNGLELTSKHTDCLALADCGIPSIKSFDLSKMVSAGSSCCTPGGGCC